MKVEEFVRIVNEELQVNEIALDTRLDGLEIWDSMARLILISIVDETFQLQIKDEDFQTILTLNDLIGKIGIDQFDS